MEGTVSVGWVSRVDTDRCAFVSRRLAGVLLAVRGISLDSSDGVVDMLSLAARHPADSVVITVDSHRVSTSKMSRAGHEGLDDVGISSRSDRSGFRSGFRYNFVVPLTRAGRASEAGLLGLVDRCDEIFSLAVR